MSLAHKLALVTIFISSTAGCVISMPAPRTRQFSTSNGLTRHQLCPTSLTDAQIVLTQKTPMTGALQCTHERATIVLINALGVRVRTIHLGNDGIVEDQVSYLASDTGSTEELLTQIAIAIRTEQPQGNAPSSTIVRITERHYAQP